MLKQVKQFIDEYQLNTKTIYLAVSGGIDSMVLTSCLHQLKVNHTLLHCNFKLRGNDSDIDESFVKDYAKQNDINCITTTFDTKNYCKKKHLTTQEGARVLRYKWFNTFLDDSRSVLLTAHHLDDQIETFFINLLRGTGLKGLTGISNKKNKIYRPLLTFTKQQIFDFATTHQIKFREDQSNQSDNYLRNRLRHHFIPLLKNETISLDAKMKTLFNELSEIDDFHSLLIREIKENLEQNLSVQISKIDELPDFMLVKLFETYNLTRKKIPELKKLFKSKNNSILLTSTHTLLKNKDQIIIKSNSKKNIVKPISVDELPARVILDDGSILFSLTTPQKNYKFEANLANIDFDKVKMPLKIRTWKNGDRIQPLGMKNTKLVSDVLKDKKMTKFDKDNQMVIVSNGEIIWLVNLMVSEKYKLTNQTKHILFIEYFK
jgi:tRNA(Ile)-lysidine synthase